MIMVAEVVNLGHTVWSIPTDPRHSCERADDRKRTENCSTNQQMKVGVIFLPMYDRPKFWQLLLMIEFDCWHVSLHSASILCSVLSSPFPALYPSSSSFPHTFVPPYTALLKPSHHFLNHQPTFKRPYNIFANSQTFSCDLFLPNILLLDCFGKSWQSSFFSRTFHYSFNCFQFSRIVNNHSVNEVTMRNWQCVVSSSLRFWFERKKITTKMVTTEN